MTSNAELLVIQYLFMYLLTIHIEGICFLFLNKYENIHIHMFPFLGSNVYPGPLSSPHPFLFLAAPCST